MTNDNQKLAGKVAVITGAGRGIGRAVAVAYAGAGASICCAARTQSEIDETVDMIEANGGKAIAVRADVTDIGDVENMFKTASDAFGGVDIVMINAGGSLERNTVENSDRTNWAATINLNLNAPYYCAKEAIPYLKERGAGKIILVGSIFGHKGKAGSSAYGCAKAGMWMLTRVLAEEVWQYNISVNELVPGPVVTRTSSTGRDPNRIDFFKSKGEWVKTPEDVVPLAMFLATQPDIGPTAQSYDLTRGDFL